MGPFSPRDRRCFQLLKSPICLQPLGCVVIPPSTPIHFLTISQKTADSLPEILPTYSDAAWTVANHKTTVNPVQPDTPVVLYAGDYGYHTGNILWRAHFNATGEELGFQAEVWGGEAFAYSVWLDSTFLGSWEGDAVNGEYDACFTFPEDLVKGSTHVLTILQDHMGYEEDWTAASDYFKNPRGILNYTFLGSNDTTVSVWKVSGNFGGESVRCLAARNLLNQADDPRDSTLTERGGR